MNPPPNCPKCGTRLPADAPEGLCPACLMSGGFHMGAETVKMSPSDRPGSQPAPTPSPQELAPYFPQLEIIELLGRGGMGMVYKARQKNLNRLVALKILPVEPDESEHFAERFQREAQALAKLNHPNIVSVFDFGEARKHDTPVVPPEPGDGRISVVPSPGLFYFLMEFVDGANLRTLIRGGEMKPEAALALIPAFCDALQYAHDEGVVHRDIKPENVLVDKKGRVKIADFGLAKLLGNESTDHTLTRSGMYLGTPRYMAPEQMDKPETVDHRADIYSLGVVFYEMLTGEVPMGRFEPPSKKVRIDVKLDEIVLHAMERDVERRYQHASEIKTDVQNVAGVPAKMSSPLGNSAWVMAILFVVLAAATTAVKFFKPSDQISPTLVGKANAPSGGTSADLDGTDILHKMKEKYASLSSFSATGTVATVITPPGGAAIVGTEHTFTMNLARPDFYRIEWTQKMKAFIKITTEGAVWSSGDGPNLQMEDGRVSKPLNREQALTFATGISGGVTRWVPGLFFKEKLLDWGSSLKNPSRLPDEKIDSEDCHVISAGQVSAKEIFWISKKSFLLKQIRSTLSGAEAASAVSRALSETSDASLEKILRATGQEATPEAVAGVKNSFQFADKAAGMKAAGMYQFTSTQTFQRIAVNEIMEKADFEHPLPAPTIPALPPLPPRAERQRHLEALKQLLAKDHDQAVKVTLEGLEKKATEQDWGNELGMIFARDEFRGKTLLGDERAKHFTQCRDYLKQGEELTDKALKAHPNHLMLSSGLDKIRGSLALACLEAGDTADANRRAQQQLNANTDTMQWNYGNVVHDANAILGRAALRNGVKPAAVEYLLKAGRTPGSPQLNSFGPDFTFAREMIEAGETKAVLDYFDLVEKFFVDDKETLDGWRADVAAGRIPDFER